LRAYFPFQVSYFFNSHISETLAVVSCSTMPDFFRNTSFGHGGWTLDPEVEIMHLNLEITGTEVITSICRSVDEINFVRFQGESKI
jgi:hypothetical protein